MYLNSLVFATLETLNFISVCFMGVVRCCLSNGLYVGIQAIAQPLIVQLQSEGGISLFLFVKFTVSATVEPALISGHLNTAVTSALRSAWESPEL